MNGQSMKSVKAIVDDIRALAVQYGRQAEDVKIFVGATVVTGRTEAQAREKFEDYQTPRGRGSWRWPMHRHRWVSILGGARHG